MKTILSFLFIVSVGLNVLFLTGCAFPRPGRWIHNTVYGNPCKYATTNAPIPKPTVSHSDDGREALAVIAEDIYLKTDGRDAATLKRDIHETLSNKVFAPVMFDSDAFEKMAKDLTSSEEGVMREYQRFIRNLQGKTIIVINSKD